MHRYVLRALFRLIDTSSHVSLNEQGWTNRRAGRESLRTILRGQDPRGGIEKLNVRKLSTVPSFRFPSAEFLASFSFTLFAERSVPSPTTLRSCDGRTFRTKEKYTFAKQRIEDKQAGFRGSKIAGWWSVPQFPIYSLPCDPWLDTLSAFYRRTEFGIISMACVSGFYSTLRGDNSHFVIKLLFFAI